MRIALRFYSLLPVLLFSGILVQAGTSPLHVTAAPVIGTTTFTGLFSGQTPIAGPGTNTLSAANVGGSGWDFTVTGTSTNLAINVPNGGGATDGTTTDYCIRTSVNAAVTDGQTLIKANDGSSFWLQSIYFRIAISGGGSADIILTGNRSGSPVSGATLTQTLVSGIWTQFNVQAINAFTNVDQIVFRQAGTTTAFITQMFSDNITIATAIPLPLTLINFSGALKNDDVQLQWSTAQESNSSHFEVQRGNNGADFAPVGRVQAAGNSSQLLHYTYTDVLPPVNSPSWYYRLKMSDLDGRFTYSSVLRIGASSSGSPLSAYPNPFGQQQLVLTVNAPEAEQTQLTVTDRNGKVIQKKSLPLQKGVNSFTLSSMASLGKGLYLLSVAISRQQHTLKVIKVE